MKHADLPIGFHPVRNRHIDAAIAAEFVEQLKTFSDSVRAHAEAVAVVARRQDPAPFRKLFRLPKPTKNNDPAYRKAVVAPVAV